MSILPNEGKQVESKYSQLPTPAIFLFVTLFSMISRIRRQIQSILPRKRGYQMLQKQEVRTDNSKPSSDDPADLLSISALSKFGKESHLVQSSLQKSPECYYSEALGFSNLLVGELESCQMFLESHRRQIEGHLRGIDLTVDLFKGDFDAIKTQIASFVEKDELETVEDAKFRRQLLSELYSLAMKQHMFERVFTKLAFFIELELKLRAAFEMFKVVNNNKDITNSIPAQFEHVYSKIQVISPPNPTEIQDNYKAMTKLFHVLAGAMVRTLPYQSKIVQKVVLGWNIILNSFSSERSLLQSLSFYRHPSLSPVVQFYNLFEDGFLGFLTGLGFAKIKTNTFIYVPVEDDNTEVKDIFEARQNTIGVRVLYHKALPLIDSKQKEEQLDSIILHMHGGGYAVHSSRSSQGFTRKWANQLKIPIFSIDYRMAPEHLHPQSAYDCFKVYSFLVEHLHKYMRIRPKNIFIAGDASGGSVACSLTALILKQKIVQPKGLFLAYPGFDFRSIYYPSRRFIFNDPMIWPTVAEVFVDAYFPNDKDKNDPLGSPLLMTEWFISGKEGDKRFPLEWPRTFMMLGDKDLVRDESLLFMQRMDQSQIPFKCLLYEHLGHGFLVTEGLIKYSTTTIQHSIELFKELIKEAKRNDLHEQ